MSIATANKTLTDKFIASLFNGDGWFPEGDTDLNEASVALVAAYKSEYGDAWLGRINPPNKDITRVLTQLQDDHHIFGYSFVIPCDDAELRRLLTERLEAPYTGTDDDHRRVSAIYDRVSALGGRPLFWS